MVKAGIVALLAIGLSGCAGTVSRMVPESDKDPENKFDGQYLAKVDFAGGRVDMPPGWYIDCSPRKYVNNVSVKSSEVMWAWGGIKMTGFINSKGKFRIEHLMDEEVKGIGAVISDGSVTIIPQGDLSEDVMKGAVVHGIGQHNNRGCSYPVTFTKR